MIAYFAQGEVCEHALQNVDAYRSCAILKKGSSRRLDGNAGENHEKTHHIKKPKPCRLPQHFTDPRQGTVGLRTWCLLSSLRSPSERRRVLCRECIILRWKRNARAWLRQTHGAWDFWSSYTRMRDSRNARGCCFGLGVFRSSWSLRRIEAAFLFTNARVCAKIIIAKCRGILYAVHGERQVIFQWDVPTAAALKAAW